MNNHLLIIALFFIACSEEKVQLISNTPSDLPNQNYKLNLRSPNSGENLESVTITWNETGENVTLTDLSTNQIEDQSGSSYTYSGFNPGDFRDIKISGSKDGTTYTDTIQIFTRPVYPVTNLSFETEGIKVGEDVWNSWEYTSDCGEDGICNENEEGYPGSCDDGKSVTQFACEFAGTCSDTQYTNQTNCEFAGTCSDTQYTNQTNCESILATWTPATWTPATWTENLDPEGDDYNAGNNSKGTEGNNIWDEGESFRDEDTTKYHRNLKWTMTNESNAKYILYRVKKENIYDLVNSECEDCQLEVLTSLSDTTYIDSSSNVIEESDEDAFYYMVQVSKGNFTRNSFIYSYTEFTQPEPIQLARENVSTDKDGFIEITWNPITNSDYFYQYEIWRASNEELSDEAQIAIIIDPEQDKFMDRTAGNGTTWYYSVTVRDISDRISDKIFVSGWSWSMP